MILVPQTGGLAVAGEAVTPARHRRRVPSRPWYGRPRLTPSIQSTLGRRAYSGTSPPANKYLLPRRMQSVYSPSPGAA